MTHSTELAMLWNGVFEGRNTCLLLLRMVCTYLHTHTTHTKLPTHTYNPYTHTHIWRKHTQCGHTHTCAHTHTHTIAYHLLWQVGNTPVQVKFAWQILIRLPSREKSELHTYTTSLPTAKSLPKRRPFSGVPGSPQPEEAIGKARIPVIL